MNLIIKNRKHKKRNECEHSLVGALHSLLFADDQSIHNSNQVAPTKRTYPYHTKTKRNSTQEVKRKKKRAADFDTYGETRRR